MAPVEITAKAWIFFRVLRSLHEFRSKEEEEKQMVGFFIGDDGREVEKGV